MSKEEKNTEKSNNDCNITILEKNTTNDHYGLFTDQIVAIQKLGQTIILVPQDLRQLEKKLGCQFKRQMILSAFGGVANDG